MTKQDKELLFKDLCARLPYHVRVKIWLKDGTTEEGALDLEHNYANVLLDAFYYNKIKDIKPYLRPMSSMTEKEQEIYNNMTYTEGERYISSEICSNVINFLNTYHFDYRGLIPMGLALEAPEDMYNFK